MRREHEDELLDTVMTVFCVLFVGLAALCVLMLLIALNVKVGGKLLQMLGVL